MDKKFAEFLLKAAFGSEECQEFEDILFDYVKNPESLDEGVRLKMEAHLEYCLPCIEKVEEYRKPPTKEEIEFIRKAVRKAYEREQKSCKKE